MKTIVFCIKFYWREVPIDETSRDTKPLSEPIISQGSILLCLPWLRHQMKTFPLYWPLCEGYPTVTGGFPSQRPVSWSLDIFFDLCLNKRLSKQSRRRSLEKPSRSFKCRCKVSRFNLDGNFVLMLFYSWPSYSNRRLHISRHHSCRIMCKIL